MFMNNELLIIAEIVCLLAVALYFISITFNAPETSLKKALHFSKEQKSILIRWYLVLKSLTYLSESLFLTEYLMKLSSINEISCPKMYLVEN